MSPRAETGRLSESVTRVTRALEAFVADGHADPMTRHDEWSSVLSGPLPEAGAGAGAVLEELERVVIPNGMRLHEPGFWGWITAEPSTVPVVTSFAASVAAPQRYTLTAFNRLEELSLEWLAQLCSLGAHMKGVYSSGGSVANLVALGAARQWGFEQVGVDPAADGVTREGAIYASSEAHHTIMRSAGVLGLGRHHVRQVPTDEHQRIDVTALRAALVADRAKDVVPIAVCATAGTTNTGAIDPLRQVGEVCREFNAWFHVDGAYGLPGVLDDRVRHLYDGLELADSVIVDPHKWLGAPVGIAATFVRDRSILHRAFTQEPAAYLEGSLSDPEDVRVSVDSMGIPYADFGVELSAPSRGAVVWSLLKELGRSGVRERIVHDNDLARHVARRAHDHERLDVLAEPTLSICCLRYRGDDVRDLDGLNARLYRRLVQETSYLPSSTIVNGHFGLRPCFINGRTDLEHVDGFCDTVVRLGDELTGYDARRDV